LIKFQDIKVGDTVGGFLCKEVREIKEINNVAYIFEHQRTKAKCVHLFNDDKNNLFSIGFRTPVFDNTGVPHILEHSVLAGSKKYPLKDPFKELLKSSMHTFLNAMTYPDRTIYPISSQVPADYFNLTDVYCDAVFNPILNEYTFAQEGWRFDVENPDSEITIKGIVYNEMKGVFSDFNSFVERNLYAGLFPDTTYFYESGGNPKNIPELSYEKFKDFHKKYYHPTNSFIVLYGNIESKETLTRINDNFLRNFDEQEINSEIFPQKKFEKPQETHIFAPSNKEDDGTATVLLAWDWGEKISTQTDIRELKMLSSYLLSGENAPLKKALLDSGFGEDIDDLSGMETELISFLFVAGLKKSKPKHAKKIADLIKNTIRKEIENGFDKEAIEGVLRRMEFKEKEIGGDASYPLNFATRIYKFWIYGCDPIKHLEFDEQFARIRRNIDSKPRYLENLLENLTLKNDRRLLLITEASSEIGEKLGKLSQEQAKKLCVNFTKNDKIKHAEFSRKLEEYHKKEHTPRELSCIPVLKKSDIPVKNETVPLEIGKIDGSKWLNSQIFTGEVFYLNLAFDLSVIPDELLEYAPLYTEYLGRCGAGGLSSGEMAKLWKLHSGGFSSVSLVSGDYRKRNSFVANNVFTIKTLVKNIPQTLDCLSKTLFEADFCDENLIKNVLNEEKNDVFDEIIQHGHNHAIMFSAARFSSASAIKYRTEGIGYYRFLKNLREDKSEILAKIQKIHSIFINSQNLTISTACTNNSFLPQIENFAKKIPSFERKVELTSEKLTLNSQTDVYGVEISSSVNYVADVFEIDTNDSKTVGEISLLSQILSRGYLWDKIRVEGGAYGGFCGFNCVSKIFSFGSFRDPNISTTFGNFEKALTQNPISQEIIDRSIPSEIGNIDSPKSPSAKVINELYCYLSHYSKDIKQEIREAILSADAQSIEQKLELLRNCRKSSQKSVLGSKDAFDEAQTCGLKLKRESL
jgi:Zn-dependent M16 (insulinase) family peptidase